MGALRARRRADADRRAAPRRRGPGRRSRPRSRFAMLLEFGLLPAVLAYAAASVIADVHARLSPVKITFNAAQYALSLAASALTLAVLGQEAPIESIAAALPAVLASAAVFFVVNHVLAGVGVALIIGESPAHYLLSDLPFQVLSRPASCSRSRPSWSRRREASMALVPLALLPVLALYIGARRAALDTHRAFHDALTDLPNRAAAARAPRARAGAGARRARAARAAAGRPRRLQGRQRHARARLRRPPARRRRRPHARRARPRRPARAPRRRRVRRPARRPVRRRARPRGRRAAGRPRSRSRSRSTGSCSTSAPASASPASPSTARPPTSCCAAPTSRSTSPRPRSARSRSTPPARTTTPSTA